MYRIFDAHCHIYPESIAQKAVEGINQFYENLPFDPYDGTTGTLLCVGRQAGISHYVVHSVATTPHQISSINRFIAKESFDFNHFIQTVIKFSRKHFYSQ